MARARGLLRNSLEIRSSLSQLRRPRRAPTLWQNGMVAKRFCCCQCVSGCGAWKKSGKLITAQLDAKEIDFGKQALGSRRMNRCLMKGFGHNGSLCVSGRGAQRENEAAGQTRCCEEPLERLLRGSHFATNKPCQIVGRPGGFSVHCRNLTELGSKTTCLCVHLAFQSFF
ncbi:hypothetical protein TRVL_08504 [Trypanosoma vivax]|nr:hypothetical protein TRVL_08504 [Trypanosoma vivax]